MKCRIIRLTNIKMLPLNESIRETLRGATDAILIFVQKRSTIVLIENLLFRWYIKIQL